MNVVFHQLKVPTSDKPGVFVNFRKLLLNRCQKEFEKDQDDDEIFERKQKELEAAKDVRTVKPPFRFRVNLSYDSYTKHKLVSARRVRSVSASGWSWRRPEIKLDAAHWAT